MASVGGKIIGDLSAKGSSLHKGSRFGVAFVLAGLITGANWLAQTRIAQSEQAKNN